MEDKRVQYKVLEEKSIYEIWNEDLDNFQNALDIYEKKEEEDRLAMKGVKNEGKRRRKAPAKKKKVPTANGPTSPTASVSSNKS